MPAIELSRVSSNRERDAFIKFPWRIYKDDPAWVPPLILERKEFLNRDKHPFYLHGDAELFLARRGGEIVGRIMASDDPNYNTLHGANVGCFGLLECVDDVQVASALFDAASDWLRGKGRSEVMGPIDYSTNYVCALLIAGFEHPPMLLTSHNPPYYASLIERCGFSQTKDWYAWWFDNPIAAAKRLRRIASRFGESGVIIRPIDMKNLAAESTRLRAIYNTAWEKNWGFVPFTEAEFKHLVAELKPVAVPEFVLIAEVNGEPAGFILGMPDINAALKHINGRLTTFGLPIGLMKLLYYKSRVRTGRLIALGVVPKFRRHGIAEQLVLRIMQEGMVKRGLKTELSMTLDDNHLINRFLEAIGARRYKTYRIYSRAIAA